MASEDDFIELQITDSKADHTLYVSPEKMAAISLRFADCGYLVKDVERTIVEMAFVEAEDFLQSNEPELRRVTFRSACRLAILAFELEKRRIHEIYADILPVHLDKLPKNEMKLLFEFLAKKHPMTILCEAIRKHILETWSVVEKGKIVLNGYIYLPLSSEGNERPSSGTRPPSHPPEEPPRRVPIDYPKERSRFWSSVKIEAS